MNGNQLKWLFDLQSKGVKFEYCNMKGEWVNNGRCTFFAAQKNCRIPTQPIPDIPDWRELCREMQSNGVRFENSSASGNNWFTGRLWGFNADIEAYRIPQQPLPEWKEEMNEETKPDQKEETPHLELQIQWHEDKLHSLRTREPMREWEYRLVVGDGEWRICNDPHFSEKYEYRRKPRTVKYWHCVVNYVCDYGTGAENVSLWSTCSKDELESEIKNIKDDDTTAKFSPIIETTVEMDD